MAKAIDFVVCSSQIYFMGDEMSLFTYFLIACLSAFLFFVSIKGIFYEKHIVLDFMNTFKTNTVHVSLPAGVGLEINASKKDRELAWKIYTQIKTRIAVEEFNEEYDSLQFVNKSLYEVFGIIRNAISELPTTIVKDDHRDLLQLYFDVLNEGIRPYLSKWHIPISHWNETETKKHPEQTLLEIEKRFPNREAAIKDMKAMNKRMKDFSLILFRVAKGEDFSLDFSDKSPVVKSDKESSDEQ